MKEYRAATTIHASPETIWAILTQGERWPEWDPGTIRIEGRIAPDEKVTAYSKLSPNRGFPVKVAEFVPGRKMTWVGGMPLGLFKGVRTFTLTPTGDGATEFTLHEVFSGPLLPLFAGSLPDMTATFEAYVAGLKQRAESAG